jgi:hypothetical protein
MDSTLLGVSIGIVRHGAIGTTLGIVGTIRGTVGTTLGITIGLITDLLFAPDRPTVPAYTSPLTNPIIALGMRTTASRTDHAKMGLSDPADRIDRDKEDELKKRVPATGTTTPL